MESVNNTNPTFLRDSQLESHNNEADDSLDFSLLFDSLDSLEILIDILKQIFIKLNQSDRTVAQFPKIQQEDSQVIQFPTLQFNESSELEDRVELLCEQIETLKNLLYYKESELQEIRQELHETNVDLCGATNSSWRSLDEAKELAKKLLVSKKSSNEILAELLDTLCNLTVTPSQLEHRETLSNSIKPLISKPVNYRFTNHKATQTKMIEGRKKATTIRAQSKILIEQACKLQAQFTEIQAQFMEQGVNFIGSQASFTARQANVRNRQKKKIHRAEFSQLDEFRSLVHTGKE
ncbi:hypothetical protein [Scytonema sp. NUACC26]|uniref:hypothetical protein n=1 Tax=Scytonema sp. NUACC26 TaxID=3140176 RepID=UPI0034DC3B9C